MRFEFKCVAGHVTELKFPRGTPLETHDQILCPTCLDKDKAEHAFLVFVGPDEDKK